MKRCNKAREGFECLKLIGHRGSCECVTSEVFNASMSSAEDAFLYGNKPKCTCGRRTPFPHCHAADCPIYSPESKGVCGKKAEALIIDYIGNKPVDELGKVWDVLHTNGVESAGELSASEGVQQLVVEHRLALDELLYGNSFATIDERGLKTRIDPTSVIMRSRKP